MKRCEIGKSKREDIGIGRRVWRRGLGLVSAGSAALLGIMLVMPSRALAGCAGVSGGSYAILLQGATSLTPEPQPVAGVGAFKLNSTNCTVSGELIYNANGTFVVYPDSHPLFTGTSAQLSGTYSMQTPYNGTLSFTDNGSCAGCSNSGLAFNFAITAHGTEIIGSGNASGLAINLTAQKQVAFSPSQLVGTFPFSCSAVSMGSFFLPGDAYSFTGETVYPSGPYIPLDNGFICGLSSLPSASDIGVTLSGMCDSSEGCFGSGAPLVPVSSQASPNASDATVNLTNLDDCFFEAAPVEGMSTVLWGSSNQNRWSIGISTEFPLPEGLADVETCSGGAGGAAGTLTISPTTMSLVTSAAKPVAQKTVAIKNNTARMVFYGISSPTNGPPPVTVTADNCAAGSLPGGILPYTSCGFTVVCTNSGGSTLTPVTVSVGLDQQATNDASNTVTVNCTH